MPPVENPEVIPVVTDKGPDVQNNTEPSKSGKALVGIIYPPLEIRNIVDKTANFVARNGIEFEARIKQHEAKNPRFNFLNPTDPYHAYYQHKVKEYAEGKAAETVVSKPTLPVLPQKVQEAIKAAEFVPKDPPSEFEFIADPATINAFDLDLIQLTALFVAKNGRQFLSELMNKESRNYQFDFLKPQHSNFGYFTKLVEQYTKILLPPKDLIQKLRKDLQTKFILDQVKYRVEWEKFQRRQREREEAEVERERIAYAQIDWHDFVVVQTVDFQPNETASLPPPCTPKDVGARLLAQQRLEATKSSTQTMEMEVESEGEDEENASSEIIKGPPHDIEPSNSPRPEQSTETEFEEEQSSVVQPPAQFAADNVLIRKDYNPRSKQLDKIKQQTEQKWIISPLTGEKIPADKLAEHMRFNTVDSQYFVQKERELHDRQDDEPVFAPGTDISANILSFAERRTDIFGVGSRGAEQTVIGKKLGEEDRPKLDPKVIWDGHTSSVEATTKAAQSQVSIQQQIQQIHRAQGLLPDQNKEKIGPKTGIVATPASHSEPVAPRTSQQTPPRPSAPAPRMIPPAGSAGPFVRTTVVPVVPAQVLLVQQPAIGMVGNFVPQARPPFPRFGAPGPIPQARQPFYGSSIPPVPSAVLGGTPSEDQTSEPSAKRQKTSEDQLTSEQEWLQMYGHMGPITVVVQCPTVTDKTDWQLNGQHLPLQLSLTEPISSIKTKIQEATSLPIGKQKLVFEGMFVKDSQSLAYYNMINDSVVQLQLKERGGRKK